VGVVSINTSGLAKTIGTLASSTGTLNFTGQIDDVRLFNYALSPTQIKESVAEYRKRRAKEAGELVRIRVTCMNPAKREWSGEIFTAGNATVGTFKKYVPFGIEEGWHVPRIIFNMIMERRCQIFQSVPDGRGGKKRVGKLIPEFAVEVLPNLTPDELRALAQRQAMANGTAEE
jgi:hypothetical protein